MGRVCIIPHPPQAWRAYLNANSPPFYRVMGSRGGVLYLLLVDHPDLQECLQPELWPNFERRPSDLKVCTERKDSKHLCAFVDGTLTCMCRGHDMSQELELSDLNAGCEHDE